MSDERAPVLVAAEARVAVDGVVAIDHLTLSTKGDRVLFAGDVAALFGAISQVPLSARLGAGALAPVLEGRARAQAREGDDEALEGEAAVVSGSLRLAGREVAEGAQVPIMGAAPLDPPLPPGWSADEYVAWGARLAGATAREASALAETALGRVGLIHARRRATSALPLPERRALVLAQAIVMSPEVLVAESPLEGLEGAAAAFVLQAIAAASNGRRALLSASRLDPGSAEGALALSATTLVVLAGGAIALEGTPAELFAGATLVSLTVTRNAEALRAELEARGITLRGGPARFSAALPAGTGTGELLRAARAAGAAVVEMVPLIG